MSSSTASPRQDKCAPGRLLRVHIDYQFDTRNTVSLFREALLGLRELKENTSHWATGFPVYFLQLQFSAGGLYFGDRATSSA